MEGRNTQVIDQTLRIASVLIAAALALSGFGGSASAGSTAPTAALAASEPATALVRATLGDDMRLTLDHYSVPAGKVRFFVTNAGAAMHELVVLRTDLGADKLMPDLRAAGKVTE